MTKVTRKGKNLKVEFTIPITEFTQLLNGIASHVSPEDKLNVILNKLEVYELEVYELEVYEEELRKSKK